MLFRSASKGTTVRSAPHETGEHDRGVCKVWVTGMVHRTGTPERILVTAMVTRYLRRTPRRSPISQAVRDRKKDAAGNRMMLKMNSRKFSGPSAVADFVVTKLRPQHAQVTMSARSGSPKRREDAVFTGPFWEGE